MTSLHTIINTEMTRKEFLMYIGILLITVLGVYKMLNLIGFHTGNKIPVQTKGYGSIPYGR